MVAFFCDFYKYFRKGMPVSSYPISLNSVEIRKIYLDKENPRHEPYSTQAQVIEYMCNNEQIVPIARDIVRHKLNPLDRIGLIHDNAEEEITKDSTFIVGEGHRRICAIKLLTDPDLAPPDFRAEFHTLSKDWKPIEEIPAVVFADKDSIRLWLNRMHNGQQGGVGRKPWTADQQHRFGGTDKNRAAMELLDYAEFEGFITAEQRKGKLTTVQRYLGNMVCCEYMGLIKTNPDGLMRNKPKADFDIITAYFVSDLQTKVVNSRAKKPDIDKYARKLSQLEGLSGEIIEPEFIFNKEDESEKKKKGTKKKPSKPKKPEDSKFITYEKEIADKLEHLGATKLSNLYYCICKLEFSDYTPLLAVGVWSFFESLTALAGRKERQNFEAYFNKDRIAQYGIAEKKGSNSINEALTRIHRNGNTTKHHKVAADFYGKQLANDMDTLKDLILACLSTITPLNEEK